MSERTIDEVRAELQEVRRQITVFGSFAHRAEQLEDILVYFTSVGERIDPSRLREIFGDDLSAWQAAEDLGVIRLLLRDPKLADRTESLRICLCGLVQNLLKKRGALEQELTALEPPEPKAIGLFERVVQVAQHALSFGHPA